MKFIKLNLFLFIQKFLILLTLFSPSLLFAEACHEVSLAGIKIVCLQAGVGSFSAADRATAIHERIEKLSADQTFDPDTLTVTDQERTSDILAGDAVIASLRIEDSQESSVKNSHELADSVRKNIQAAIKKDREMKSPQELLRGSLFALAATIGLAVLLFLLSIFYRHLYSFIRRGEGSFIPSFRIQTYDLLTSRRFVEVLVWIAQSTRIVVTLIALYIYVPLVLSFFPATSNLAPKLYGYIANPLHTIFKVVIDFIPNLFFIIVIVTLTRFALKIVRFIFNEIEQENLKFNGFYKEWADPTYKLFRLLIVAFAAVMAFPFIPGSSSPAFQGITVFLGVLVSIGSSSSIGNIVAGVVLTYMRPFRIGDRVEIAGTTGDVVEKTLLVTRILTIKNVDITIPNSQILSSHILNFSTRATDKGLILNTTVTIGYDASWTQVHELLIKAALLTQFIEKDLKPFVLQTSLDDFYVSYQLNAYTRAPNRMALTYSELHQNIQNCFNAAGVEIMSPHYSSLRDGNEITIPANLRDKNYVSPKFGVEMRP